MHNTEFQSKFKMNKCILKLKKLKNKFKNVIN